MKSKKTGLRHPPWTVGGKNFNDMKYIKYSLIGFAILVIICHVPFVGKSILCKIDSGRFRYSNIDGSYTSIQGFGFKDAFYTRNSLPPLSDPKLSAPKAQQIYRLYKINWLCFWRWQYYIVSSSKFEYKDWKEIEKHRVPYEKDNYRQDF